MLVSPKRVSLKDLPPPPQGKRGWPWTTRVKPLPERMPTRPALRKICCE